MPTYQYACNGCGHRFDIVQGFHEDALTTCPDCGQSALRKLFGNVGVVFKGSGFYRTDSRSGEAKKGSGSTAGKSTSTSSDSGSKAGSTSSTAGSTAAAGTSSSSSSGATAS